MYRQDGGGGGRDGQCDGTAFTQCLSGYAHLRVSQTSSPPAHGKHPDLGIGWESAAPIDLPINVDDRQVVVLLQVAADGQQSGHPLTDG